MAPNPTMTFKLTEKTVVIFADREAGKRLLSMKDDFIGAMGAFDKSVRMKKEGVITDDDFLSFVGGSALEWDSANIELIIPSLERIKPGIQKYAHLIPDKIFLVKTTGDEEFKSAYTRQNAIILPLNKLDYTIENMARLIAHEIFHIVSRLDPALREKLYGVIGFKKCGNIGVPGSMKDRTLTNLDTPGEDYYISLEYDGEKVDVIPLFFLKDDQCDIKHGEDILQYIIMRYLAIEKYEGEWRHTVKDGKPRIIDPEKVSGFYEQVGRNTDYVICPEEILAESFMLLVMDVKGLPSPQILKNISALL